MEAVCTTENTELLRNLTNAYESLLTPQLLHVWNKLF
jgi:hypothetical protein